MRNYILFCSEFMVGSEMTQSIASTFIPEDRARRVDFQGTERWVVSGYLASISSLPYVNLVIWKSSAFRLPQLTDRPSLQTWILIGMTEKLKTASAVPTSRGLLRWVLSPATACGLPETQRNPGTALSAFPFPGCFFSLSNKSVPFSDPLA